MHRRLENNYLWLKFLLWRGQNSQFASRLLFCPDVSAGHFQNLFLALHDDSYVYLSFLLHYAELYQALASLMVSAGRSLDRDPLRSGNCLFKCRHFEHMLPTHFHEVVKICRWEDLRGNLHERAHRCANLAKVAPYKNILQYSIIHCRWVFTSDKDSIVAILLNETSIILIQTTEYNNFMLVWEQIYHHIQL